MTNMAWLVVYCFLCVELVIVTLLVLPLPKKARRLVLRLLASGSQLLHLGKVIHYISLSLLFGIVESLTDAYRLQLKLKEPPYGSKETSMVSFEVHNWKQRQFRSQRNFYLASFSLTLLFVIGKLFELTSRVYLLESQLENKLTSEDNLREDGSSSNNSQDKHAKKEAKTKEDWEAKSVKATSETKKIV